MADLSPSDLDTLARVAADVASAVAPGLTPARETIPEGMALWRDDVRSWCSGEASAMPAESSGMLAAFSAARAAVLALAPVLEERARLRAENERLRHERDVLGQALGEACVAAGGVRDDIELTGPQLLLAARDLKERIVELGGLSETADLPKLLDALHEARAVSSVYAHAGMVPAELMGRLAAAVRALEGA